MGKRLADGRFGSPLRSHRGFVPGGQKRRIVGGGGKNGSS